jgi:Bacterial toxin 23
MEHYNLVILGLRVDEDAFPLGDKDDRFFTGGGTITYKVNDDVTLAAGLGMITGERERFKINQEIGPYGTYDPDYERGPYRGGALYGGVIYKGSASFVGINSERVLHGVQNLIHRHTKSFDGTRGIPYFYNHNYPTKSWSYFGNHYNANSFIY